MPTSTDGKRHKVAHLIHLDGPGGGPLSVISQISYLKDYYDTVVFHGGASRIAEACKRLGIQHVQLPIDKVYKCLWGFWVLVFELRRVRPNLLILHGQWAGPLGALAGHLAGVKRTLYVARWPAFYTDWDWWRVNRNFLCEWIPCRLSDKVITLSESSRYQYLFRGWVHEEDLVTIPNSMDFASLPTPDRVARIRTDNGWDDSLLHVISVGRLSDQKRLDWLLKSWNIVRRTSPHARLWIVGDGKDRQRLGELARHLDLGETCTFLGSQPNGIDYIAAADIVVITSTYESFGRVALEAMACGKPIVASRVDGLVDLIRNGVEGFLVPGCNIESFAGCICRLLSDQSLRREMGRSGSLAAQNFASKNVMPQLADIIHGLLEHEG